jgi:hypothetical protein
MVATEDYRRTTGLQGDIRNVARDTLRETSLAQHSGEGLLGPLNINARYPSKRPYSQDSASYHRLAPMSSQDTEWMVVEPIPRNALATSLPPSPAETACPTSQEFGERDITTPIEIKHDQDGANGHSSHSTPKSCRSSSSSMSLESKTTVGKEHFNHFRYQHPQTPSVASSVLINREEDLPSFSEKDMALLLKLRRRIQLLRIQIQGQRRVVELKREALFQADEQYIKRIRTNHVAKDFSDQTSPTEVVVLENLWRLCQSARDSYGPAEDSLRSMENRLEGEEARLLRVEERLYRRLESSQSRLYVASPLQIEDDSSSQDGGNDATSEPGSTKSKPAGEVDYDDYLWRLGNLDLLYERRQGLFNEKLMLEGEQEKRHRVGMVLDAESLDFLGHFEEIMAPVTTEIEEVSRDVERLKELCIKKGLMDSQGNPTGGQAIDENPDSNLQEEQPELPDEHSKPSKHENPSGSNEADFRVSASHGGFGPFINLWLLHKLRSSAVEVLVLACCVAETVKNWNELNWQAEALRLWDQDGAWESRPEPPLECLESYVTSISCVYANKKPDKEDLITFARETHSMNSFSSWPSHRYKSLLRPKAKSAF